MAAAEGTEGMIPWELDSEVSARRDAEFVVQNISVSEYSDKLLIGLISTTATVTEQSLPTSPTFLTL